MSETKTMKLTVQSQTPIFRGDRGTLFAVSALNEDNYEVPDLRTFHPALPVGKLVEYEMTAYDHPTHGRTWTIKYEGAGLADRVGALEAANAEMEKRLKALERRLGEPEKKQAHPAQDHGDDLPRGPSYRN